MDDFQKQGFLGNDLSEFEDAFRKKYESWLNFLYEINSYAQALQYKLDINNENCQQLVCASLYARCVSMYQATITISIKGMETQATILLRCLLEALFSLVASSKSEEVVRKFVNADLLERRKFFNKACMCKGASLKALADKHATDEVMQKIQSDINEFEAKKFSTEEISKKAELHDWYLTAYSIFSHSVHSSARDLEKHLIIDGKWNISGLKNEPINDDYDLLFATAAESMLHALKAVERVFALNTSDFVKEKYKILDELLQKLKDVGIGLPITEEASHTTGRTDHVSGDSADQAD